MAKVCSVAASVFASGVFITSTPARVAASTSMLSRPTPARPATFKRLAAANTSAGAPWLICVTRAVLPAKLYWMLALGCLVWKAAPSSLNAEVRLAAANTLIAPVTVSGLAVGAVAGPGVLPGTAS